MTIAHEVRGSGPAVLLVHEGVADRRMWRHQIPVLEPNHTVDGNPMRMSNGPVALRRDDAWRTGLSRTDRRLTIALTAPLALTYGYGLR